MGLVLALDEHFLEEALVEEAANLRAAEAVDLVALVGEGERPFQSVLDLGIENFSRRKESVGGCQLISDAGLLFTRYIGRDGTGDDTPAEPPTF